MEYPKISDKKCKHCQNFIFMKRKRDEVKEFCGRKCAAQFLKSTSFNKNCLLCNKEFITIPSHNYDFCSQKCANQSRCITHIRNCERCNKEFVLDNIAYEKRGGGRFCSRECGTRIYEFNENYFQNIDAEDKAYWLGILLSDGNLYKTQMTLKLKRADRSHLEKFKLALNSEHPIHDDVSPEGHEFSIFLIGSKKLSIQLKNIGVIPNKTFIVQFPKIDQKLYSHFIRGYFDGDGCMYTKNKHHTWSIYSASPKFIKKLLKILKIETKLEFNQYDNVLSLSKKDDIIELEQYLYKDASIFLQRKRDKFLEAISYINRFLQFPDVSSDHYSD